MSQTPSQSDETIRRAVVFRGRVQGVGFRFTVRSLAGGRPVTGWVRNEPDGAVRMEAQGSPEAVAALLAIILNETPGRIDTHDETELAPVAGETGFAIHH